MGVDGRGAGIAQGGGIALTAAARVVPAVPTFAVDQGFWYALTDAQRGAVALGSVVRVPLGGRRVRGYVVETGERDPARLRTVTGLSMAIPVFNRQLLSALTWAAHRYVAPLSVLLDRAAPPNRVEALGGGRHPPESRTAPHLHPLTGVGQAAARRERRPPVAFVTTWSDTAWLEALFTPVLTGGGGAMLIAATAEEVATVGEHARRTFGDLVVTVTGEMSDADITEAWAQAQVPPCLLVGTPRVACWPAAGLGVAAVLEEGRRAMKDRQTPTLAVRDLMRTRASVAGHQLAFVGPTPSLETLASGATVLQAGGRAWPAVEVVDRNVEPPTAGVIGSQAMRAIRAVIGRSGRVFVFAHRRGYAAAVRCQNCRSIRRCSRCGSRPERGEECPRCGAVVGPCRSCGHDRFVPVGAGVGRVVEELRRVVGTDVAAAPAEAPVQVGSEADLAGVSHLDLAVAVDPDGLILGTHFRAAEEALRVLARLAGRVQGRGARALIQTYLPDHPVVVALRRGDPLHLLTAELRTREQFGLPPAGELVIVEARGDLPGGGDGALREAAAGAVVLGPAVRPSGAVRWLLQGVDLTPARHNLRALVQQWRDAGVTVRVDVDPIEL